jgi:hypothetical protein
MQQELIAITQYCSSNHIDITFINTLEEEGLLQVISRDENRFISEEQLPELELYSRWYLDLGINIEGIDTIRHLLQRIKDMQQEIDSLKSKLRLHE